MESGTIYISGKITGNEIAAQMQFHEAELRLKDCGWADVINPLDLDHDHDKSWESYMKVCIAALVKCQAIYLLENWSKSKGARIERQLAKDLGLTVIYEKTIVPSTKEIIKSMMRDATKIYFGFSLFVMVFFLGMLGELPFYWQIPLAIIGGLLWPLYIGFLIWLGRLSTYGKEPKRKK